MQLNNQKEFADKFLSKLLENGFGAMPKREIEIYLIHLLLVDEQFMNESGELDFHEMSLVLKMSETRVKNLVYEVDLKYSVPKDFVSELIGLIEHGKFEIYGTEIKFAVHSPMLKQAFEYEVRKLGGVSDGSFAKHVVTISQKTFECLINRLYGKSQKAQEIINALPADLRVTIVNQESLVKEFVQAFIKTSGGRTADLLFDAISPVDLLRRLIGRE